MKKISSFDLRNDNYYEKVSNQLTEFTKCVQISVHTIYLPACSQNETVEPADETHPTKSILTDGNVGQPFLNIGISIIGRAMEEQAILLTLAHIHVLGVTIPSHPSLAAFSTLTGG